MNKRVVIIGGGTSMHVRNHFSFSMNAYGTTAKQLSILSGYQFKDMDVGLYLTRMACGGDSFLETNEDISNLVDDLIADLSVKVIFFNVALCDFEPKSIAVDTGNENIQITSTEFGKYEPRLSSRLEYTLNLAPTDKIVGKIRAKRKDIFLVAFKTTCGFTEDEQYLAGLELLKKNSCNLVLANDTKTRLNMIITPEEARYHVTTNRDNVLSELVEMAKLRSHLTFTRSTVVAGEPVAWNSSLVPETLRTVVDYCIEKNAYKPFNGATVGHFACKLSDNEYLTSIRKSNFNDIGKLGLVRIKTDGPDSVLAYGARPSVGGQSQRIVFSDHPEYDCIVHFHCEKKPDSIVPTISQREYECGSHECGQNTSKGLTKFIQCLDLGNNNWIRGNISAVYLENHGPNIVFDKSIDPRLVISFIKDHFDLSTKTGGPVSLT